MYRCTLPFIGVLSTPEKWDRAIYIVKDGDTPLFFFKAGETRLSNDIVVWTEQSDELQYTKPDRWTERLSESEDSTKRCYQGILNARRILALKESKKPWFSQAYEHIHLYHLNATLRIVMAQHLIEKGQPAGAYLLVRECMDLQGGEPWDRVSMETVYRLLAQTCKAVDDREVGLVATDGFVLNKDYKDKHEMHTRRVDYLYELRPEKQNLYTVPPIPTEDGKETYKLCNPSIRGDTVRGRIGIFRGVNYKRLGDHFEIYHPQRIMNTKNILVRFDENWKIVEHKELRIQAPIQRFPCPYTGLEDARLIDHEYFTATFLEANPHRIGQICLCHYDYDTGIVDRIIPLKGAQEGRVEKNWLPFLKDGKLFIIYLYHPFIIYEINKETGERVRVIQKQLPMDLGTFRGSGNPIPYTFKGQKGFLFTIHEAHRIDMFYYWNRFVWMNEDFDVKAISKPFRYDNQHQIEMLTGITDAGDRVYGWTGVNDRFVMRYDVEKKRLEEMLEWIQF